mgnify:CR=1 FL=1
MTNALGELRQEHIAVTSLLDAFANEMAHVAGIPYISSAPRMAPVQRKCMN